MGIYRLRFHVQALREWEKLDGSVKALFKKKLEARLHAPHVPKAKLSGMKDCYKIKLSSVGYRLVYRVEDDIVFVTVIAVGRRERSEVYDEGDKRL